jgi:hypothetical protein
MKLKRVDDGEYIPPRCTTKYYVTTLGNRFSDDKSAQAVFSEAMSPWHKHMVVTTMSKMGRQHIHHYFIP